MTLDTKYATTGQNWTTDGFTPDELEAVLRWYREKHGVGDLDLVKFVPFMLALRPDAFKRYRWWVETISAGHDLRSPVGPSTAIIWLHYYVTIGYGPGALYEIIAMRDRGATRAEVAQAIALGWLHGGPQGMYETAATALDYMRAWPEDDGAPGAVWTEGWTPDPGAFRAGLDFSSTSLTAGELELLQSWHERVQGEVPAYVRLLGRHYPSALKVWRARYENAADGPLPKQVIALFQVHTAALMREREALRRAVHMAKAFGLARDHVVFALTTPHVYLGDLGMGALDVVEPYLEDWE